MANPDRIPYTKDVKNRINNVKSLTGFSSFSALFSGTSFAPEDAPYILKRDNTESLPGNIDTFIIYTSANPRERLTYKAKDNTVRMNDNIDGGFF